VERMCFLEEGWVGLRGLDMADFVSVEVFKLNVEILKADCEVDLDLDRLKLLKSLHVKANGLTVRAHGLGALTNLSYLYWSASGISPWLDDIRHLTNLRVLKLINCLGVKILDFTELKLLRAAQIDHFPDLITLRGLSSMKVTLRSLTIAYCKSLQECLGLDELDALEVLELWSCGKLKEVPCLGQLTKLRKLFIYDCKSIMVLPGLGDLVALEELEIWGSSKLSVLPDLVKLTKLQTLDIGDCPMQEVPTLDIGDCPMQEVPGLDGLVALTRLRASFEKLLGDPPVLSNLSKLTSVTLHYWNGPIWMSIQNLLMLENLGLWYCKDGDIMPDLQSLRRLRSVSIGSCNFKDLSGLSNSTTLERLDVMYCDELKRLPRFERLTKLTGLRIMGCDNLSEWPSASNLCSLKQLRVDGLSLTKIVSLHEILSNLRELELHGKGCEHVLKMASLSQLETLTIFNWETTEALDLSSTFPQLKELELRSCSALKRMMCSIPMSSMTKLVVMPCENLVEMPDLSLFPQLEELRIFGCGSLTRLTCSSHLSALREIYLWNGCSSQIELPDLSRFPKLTRRYIDNDEDVDNGDDHEDKDNGDDHEDEDMALL
jgi:Leucine-rich repeat (LRR) protein